ncbi:MRP-L47-domain-containing protein, partial [Meira miltonrushii]
SSRAFSCTPSTSSAPRVEATRPASQEKTVVPKDIYQLTKEYPRHPLLGFFGRESRKVKLPGTEGQTREERVPVALAVSDLGPDRSGRSWMAAELRTKSSLELHQLWYVCLLERNKLATTKTEIQRAGATAFAALANYNGKRIEARVRKTMARIKFVLNERRIALLDAQ